MTQKSVFIFISILLATTLAGQVIKHEKAIESITALEEFLVTSSYRNKISILDSHHNPIHSFFLQDPQYNKGGYLLKSFGVTSVLLQPKHPSIQTSYIYNIKKDKKTSLSGNPCIVDDDAQVHCMVISFNNRYQIESQEIHIYDPVGSRLKKIVLGQNSHRKNLRFFHYIKNKETYVSHTGVELKFFHKSGKMIKHAWAPKSSLFGASTVDEKNSLIYIAVGNSIRVYNSSGTQLNQFNSKHQVIDQLLFSSAELLWIAGSTKKSFLCNFNIDRTNLSSIQITERHCHEYAEKIMGQTLFLLDNRRILHLHQSLKQQRMILNLFDSEGQAEKEAYLELPYSLYLNGYVDKKNRRIFLTFLDNYTNAQGQLHSPPIALEGIVKVFDFELNKQENIFNY